MADVNLVRLAEGKAPRTPDTRLSNADSRHKTFGEGFSVRRVLASSHAAFPRHSCRHSFDLQINKMTPPADVCLRRGHLPVRGESSTLPGLSQVMDGSRRNNSRSITLVAHSASNPLRASSCVSRRRPGGRPGGTPQASQYERHRCLVPTPDRRNGEPHTRPPPGDGDAEVPLALGKLAGCRHVPVRRPCPWPR